MRIFTHHSDRQLIGDPVIEAETDCAGGEVVAPGVPIAVRMAKSDRLLITAVFSVGLF
jgi:hypothetical protein